MLILFPSPIDHPRRRLNRTESKRERKRGEKQALRPVDWHESVVNEGEIQPVARWSSEWDSPHPQSFPIVQKENNGRREEAIADRNPSGWRRTKACHRWSTPRSHRKDAEAKFSPRDQEVSRMERSLSVLLGREHLVQILAVESIEPLKIGLRCCCCFC